MTSASPWRPLEDVRVRAPRAEGLSRITLDWPVRPPPPDSLERAARRLERGAYRRCSPGPARCTRSRRRTADLRPPRDLASGAAASAARRKRRRKASAVSAGAEHRPAVQRYAAGRARGGKVTSAFGSGPSADPTARPACSRRVREGGGEEGARDRIGAAAHDRHVQRIARALRVRQEDAAGVEPACDVRTREVAQALRPRARGRRRCPCKWKRRFATRAAVTFSSRWGAGRCEAPPARGRGHEAGHASRRKRLSDEGRASSRARSSQAPFAGGRVQREERAPRPRCRRGRDRPRPPRRAGSRRLRARGSASDPLRRRRRRRASSASSPVAA